MLRDAHRSLFVLLHLEARDYIPDVRPKPFHIMCIIEYKDCKYFVTFGIVCCIQDSGTEEMYFEVLKLDWVAFETTA